MTQTIPSWLYVIKQSYRNHFFTENIPASAKHIPANVNDSNNPILSLASCVFARNLGICNKTNQPAIIIPESKAAHFTVCGTRMPTPPAIKQIPQKYAQKLR